MRAVRHRLRRYAWLAILAIAALAICPTISRLVLPEGFADVAHGAQPSRDSASIAEPSPHGTGAAHDHYQHHDSMMLTGAMPVSSHAPSHQHTLEHCGFCVLAAHAFAVAPAPAVVLTASDYGSQAYDGGAPAVPRLRCDWSPASSRGPPLRG